MNIGILTYHYASNFGANLQALSTVSYLKRLGHTPVVLNWCPPDVVARYVRSTPPMQVSAHRSFGSRFLNLSEECATAGEIASIIEKKSIRAVVIGSDAVASVIPKRAQRVLSLRRMRYVTSSVESTAMVPNPFWGTFSDNLRSRVPCGMLSVSAQNARFELLSEEEQVFLEHRLSGFAFVSVRDEWTQRMFRWISHDRVVPEITPDPVFAINQSVQSSLFDRSIISRFGLPERYILLSFKRQHGVSDRWIRQFRALAESDGFECVALPFPQEQNTYSLSHRIHLPLDPLEWYSLIKHSSGYVGHNMHPIVCCVHNAVPFFSFDNYGTLQARVRPVRASSKIYCLLCELGLLKNSRSVIGPLSRSPAPKEVFEALMKFDRGECEKKAKWMASRFGTAVEQLVHKLSDVR